MSENNLNRKFFTEADSPVPLLPADMAWDNMQKKLNEPEEKKRRFIIWIPPFIWILFGALLTGAVAMIWNGQRKGIITTKDTKQTVAAGKPNQFKSSKDIFTSEPTLTAQSQNKRTAHATKMIVKLCRTVKENSTGGDDDERSLPFAFPERVVLTDSISVQAYVPLPSFFNEPPKEDSVNKAVWVEAGLHWNVPVPVEGNDHYLLGPNGKDQPWQYLLPGVWLSVNKNKQRIIVSANPFVSAPLTDKSYGWGAVPVRDSIPVVGQKRMVKMFGYQASLQYGYKLGDHWWLSGGISANWWKKGLVYARPADSVSRFKPFLYSVNTKDESAVTGFQMSAIAALSYQFKACEAILQVNAPFTETIKKVQSPLWIRLGVRWRLTSSKVYPWWQ